MKEKKVLLSFKFCLEIEKTKKFLTSVLIKQCHMLLALAGQFDWDPT